MKFALLYQFGAESVDATAAYASPDPSALPDETLVEQQEMAALDRAISALPTALKEPLLLTAFEGLAQQEAGDILGISAKSVETRVYRARKILAQTLDPGLRPKR